MLGRLRDVFRVFIRRERFERRMSDELRFHVDAYAADLRKRGLSDAEAARQARAAFGSVDVVRDDCRRARGVRWWDELRQDVTYALRLMRRSPAFTVAVVLSLGLGIGANTAIFSLIDAVLLRSLPVRNPHELYFLAHGEGDRPSLSANYPLFERYQTVPSFSGVTMFRPSAFVTNAEGVVELIRGQYVSGNYHAVVGAPIILGRGFVSEPDRPSANNGIAVISESYWARRFGRAPDVVGRTLVIEGRRVSIVGVERETGFMPGMKLEISLPFSLYAERQPTVLASSDGFTAMPIVARLGQGLSEAQALAGADVAFQQFMSGPSVRWAREQSPNSYSTARLEPAGRGQDDLRHQYRVPLLILIAMAALVLLVAAANVANLLLARSSARARETAIRLCVGSGRWRIVRQLLTESALLALAGAALGVFIAQWGTDVLVTLFGTWRRPLVLDVSMNLRVLSFTTAVALTTGLVFGVLPALKMTSVDLTPSLKANGAEIGVAGRRSILSRGLVVTQVALCVVALVTSTLLAQSVRNLKGHRPGFDASDVLLFDVASYGVPLSQTDLRSLYAEVVGRVTAYPGVRSVSVSTMTPLNPSGTYRGVVIEGQPETPDARGVFWNQVSESYFRTTGIRVLQGRTFEARDMRMTGNGVVLNARAARHIFKDANPIGRTIEWMSARGVPVEVIGVVEDTVRDSLREDPPRMVYSPLADETPFPPVLQIAVKTSASAGPLVASVRELIGSSGRNVAVDPVRTMEDQINGSLVRERGLAWLSSAFAALAAVLACVGLYGVMSYQVARRTREIGIRLAIGARPGTVLGSVLRQSVALTAFGVGIGLVAAWFATDLVSTFLYGLSPRDPLTLLSVGVGLVLTAIAATYLPARRAARIDPLRALRVD